MKQQHPLNFVGSCLFCSSTQRGFKLALTAHSLDSRSGSDEEALSFCAGMASEKLLEPQIV